MELVYIGLSTHVRRRGLGKILVQTALSQAAEEGRQRLTLAVDSRNVPALHLYFRHGFQKVGEKTAFIRDLRGAKKISVDDNKQLGAAAS
jgi:ribosomal-protein-alanine N-acetyltransferase